MPVERVGDGGLVITGDSIGHFRLLTLWSGLKLEAKGIKMSRGRSCLSIVKHEFGLKGRTPKVLEEFEAILRQRGILKPVAS